MDGGSHPLESLVGDAADAASPIGTKTTCPYCGVGCGVLVTPSTDGLRAEIAGDPNHPANFGRLCSKGAALGETLALDDRLLMPEADGAEVAWAVALDRVADAFRSAIDAHGPDSVAMYVSGQILTEDYYIANKFMKGFVGTANIDTNSRLCMASSVAGHKRAFGADTVPGTYEDLETADLVVLVGSNLAWCHPVLFQRLRAAREIRGTRVVVIDPRATASCEIADLHLAIAPGSDVALFNGLLAHLVATGQIAPDYIADHTSGLHAALEDAAGMSLADISRITGLAIQQIDTFYELFARHERAVTVYSQGVNQSSAGTDKVNAILNCHLATGRIGKPGMGPFSVTGQPNAMGGRETGGLSNMLAAHMELADPNHRKIVSEFWGVDRVPDAPGFKAVDLFEAVHDGRIKALWIMATNPVDSLPNADRVREAIANCPFVAVSDVTRKTDTTELADVLLPAAAWGEKDGTVTNSERRMSRQRQFLSLPGDVKPDWWQVQEVARRLGFGDQFNYRSPRDIFVEYAALTGIENGGSRDLDISALAELTPEDYDALEPVQWPVAPDGPRRDTRFFAEGGFFTPDRRGRFVATPYKPPLSATSDAFPFALNTGRIRDQWHTMTRTAKTSRLTAHYSEPFVQVNPSDAAQYEISPGDLVVVRNGQGRVTARAVLTDDTPVGIVFLPMHWTGQFASAGRTDVLLHANMDPVSGQPELKFSPVAIERFEAAWFAFAVTRSRPAVAAFDYAAVAPASQGGNRAELAGLNTISDWQTFAESLLIGRASDQTSVLAYHDRETGQHRFAAFEGDRCIGLLFAAGTPVTASRTWAIEQFGRQISGADRFRLLAGRPGADVPDRGPIVCACFEVGQADILRAITSGEATSVDAVGACTKAGTNCGSCRSEIGRLLDAKIIAKAG
ncbi:MAG: molybdopterin-dependent oxidoreductase [Pseudomonadota bacterium]